MKKFTLLATGLFLFVCCGFACSESKKCTRSDSDQPDLAQCIRGDVNRNVIACEIADAVLFANFFVHDTSIFTDDVAYQICATDVNADGETLTLSDLVYLMRIILQDAIADPTPSSDTAWITIHEDTISVDCPSSVGGLHFVFSGTVEPNLLSTGMEVLNNDDKVLIWSTLGNSIDPPASVLTFAGDANLVSASAVDRDSRRLRVAISK